MKYIEFKKKVKGIPVISTDMLGSFTQDVETLRVQLTHWKKKGLVLALRRGLYALSREDRWMELSPFFLANQIFIPSYVSLESALAFYGLIPEFVSAVTSLTVRKTCRFKNEFGVFTYQHVKSEAYTGFQSVREFEKMSFLVATPEKAVVDFLYLNLAEFPTNDGAVFEKSYRFGNCEGLNPKKLKAYARIFSSKKLLSVTELFIHEIVL